MLLPIGIWIKIWRRSIVVVNVPVHEAELVALGNRSARLVEGLDQFTAVTLLLSRLVRTRDGDLVPVEGPMLVCGIGPGTPIMGFLVVRFYYNVLL